MTSVYSTYNSQEYFTENPGSERIFPYTSGFYMAFCFMPLSWAILQNALISRFGQAAELGV